MSKAQPRSTRTLRRIRDLAAAGLIVRGQEAELENVAARYAVAITPDLAGLIDPADPADPIARQFVPDARELVPSPEERADPIGDAAKSPIKGIVHRYSDRVLLTPVHVCPVYCRFCFRREKVGPGGVGARRASNLFWPVNSVEVENPTSHLTLTGVRGLLCEAAGCPDYLSGP